MWWAEGPSGQDLHPCISSFPHPCIPKTSYPTSLHPCIPTYLHPHIPASLHPCLPGSPCCSHFIQTPSVILPSWMKLLILQQHPTALSNFTVRSPGTFLLSIEVTHSPNSSFSLLLMVKSCHIIIFHMGAKAPSGAVAGGWCHPGPRPHPRSGALLRVLGARVAAGWSGAAASVHGQFPICTSLKQ